MLARRVVVLLFSLLMLPASALASDYLFVWGMETRDASMAMPPAEALGRDFLAVFDIRSGRRDFGKMVAMLPVGSKAQMAHHVNYDMPADGRLFASDYMSGDAYAFDLSQPTRPRLVASFSDAGAYTHSHSFARLADGDTLATYQFRGPPDKAAGALVELDPRGRVVRASDAADPTIEPFIRPYSLVAVPALDRVVTTSASMLPTDKTSHVVQVWRLSDLKLLKTVVLQRPPHFADALAKNASEPRLLADGKTVLVVTSGCGLYKINDLAGDPTATLVYDFGDRSCGVPTVSGHYWIQTSTSGHSILSVDVSDPSHPRRADELILPGEDLPHWIAHEPEGNRLVVTGFGAMATKVLFANIDEKTGRLRLEPAAIDFNRSWPDGWTAAAMPHGAVFSLPRQGLAHAHK